MSKRTEDPLVSETGIALMPGRSVRWNGVSGPVCKPDGVQERVQALAKTGEARRAMRLYEIFLSGVHDHILTKGEMHVASLWP
jgi:hypothetical protein